MTDNQFNEICQKIFNYMADEYRSGHKDYSLVSPVKIGVDPKAFRKACLDLRGAGVIHCKDHYGGDDTVPIHVFDIHFTDLTIKSL